MRPSSNCFPSEDKTLLVRRNTFLVLDLLLNSLDSIRRLNFKGDGLPGEGLHEDLHTTTKAEDQVEGRLLLDVVVREGAAVLKLLSSKNETLLVRRDTFLVLDLLLNGLDGIGGLDFEGDGLSSQSLDEDLHTTTKAEDQVKGGLLLDVVVGEGAAIFQLLSSEDKTLLVRGNSFLVLDLLLHGLNGIRRLDFEGDGLAGEGLHEDLHTTTKAEDQVKSGLLLDVVVREGAAVLELLSSEDKTLLVRRNTFLVLDLLLHGLNGIRRLNFKGDGLPGEGLHEDLHTTTKAEDQVEGRLLLDVVVREGAAVLELLSSKNETLLVRRDTFLVLDLLLHSLDGVRGLHLEGDRLPGEGLHENLHVVGFERGIRKIQPPTCL